MEKLKSLNKYSITQITIAFSIALIVSFALTILFQNYSAISNFSNKDNIDTNQSLSEIEANFISQNIQNKTTLINVNRPNFRRIKSAEDAALFLEPWMQASDDIFEYSKYKKTSDRNLKREFTYFNNRFFKNVEPKRGLLLRKNAPGTLDFLTNFSDDELQYRLLADEGNNLRLLILFIQPNSDDYHLFKFLITPKSFDLTDIKLEIVNSENQIIFPFNQKNVVAKSVENKASPIEKTNYSVRVSKTNLLSGILFKNMTRSVLMLSLIFSSIAIVILLILIFPFDREKKKLSKEIDNGNYSSLDGPHLDKNLAPLLSSIQDTILQKTTHIEKQSENISDLTKHNVAKDNKNKEFAQVIHMIFSSLELGFFIFNRDGSISELYNRYFQDMVNKPVSKLSMVELFGPEAEVWRRNIFQGSTTIDDLNLVSPLELQPSVLRDDEKYRTKYYPLCDHNNHLTQIICVLENISEKANLTNRVDSSHETLEIIAAINNDKNFFRDFLRNIETIQRDVQKFSIDFENDEDFFAITYSSLKAILPYLDYFHLGSCINLISEFDLEKKPESREKHIESLNNLFEGIFLNINSYAPFTGITPFSEDQDQQESTLTAQYFENVEFIFRNLLESKGKVCHRFKLIDEIESYNYSSIKKFMFLLFDAYTNISSHATLPPAVRRAENKNDGISVTTKVFKQNGRIVFEIEDDGAGIDPKVIKDLLKTRDSDRYSLNKSDEDIILEVFKDGISTNQNQNKGYGLALLRREVNILNGRYRIESELGAGTKITLEIPLS